MNHQNIDGSTVLMYAFEGGYVDLMQTLLDAGESPLEHKHLHTMSTTTTTTTITTLRITEMPNVWPVSLILKMASMSLFFLPINSHMNWG